MDNGRFVDLAMKCKLNKIFGKLNHNSRGAFKLLARKYCPKNRKEIERKIKQLQKHWNKNKSVLEELYNKKIVEFNVVCWFCLFFSNLFFQ